MHLAEVHNANEMGLAVMGQDRLAICECISGKLTQHGHMPHRYRRSVVVGQPNSAGPQTYGSLRSKHEF